MLLGHATPAQNVESIEENGLLVAFSEARRQVVWLHSQELEDWATIHVAARHYCNSGRVKHFTVDVPRTWITHVSRGLWTCCKNIAPCRLIGTPAHKEFLRTKARLTFMREYYRKGLSADSITGRK